MAHSQRWINRFPTYWKVERSAWGSIEKAGKGTLIAEKGTLGSEDKFSSWNRKGIPRKGPNSGLNIKIL